MAKILPLEETRDVAVVSDCGVRFTLPVYRLRLAASRAALPLLPITQELHLLVESGLFDQGVEFRTGKALAERFGAIGDAPRCQRSNHGVHFQFALVHFV